MHVDGFTQRMSLTLKVRLGVYAQPRIDILPLSIVCLLDR